jgi:hypothetical protein
MTGENFWVVRCWECNIPLGVTKDDFDFPICCAACAIAYYDYIGPMMLDGVKMEGEEE